MSKKRSIKLKRLVSIIAVFAAVFALTFNTLANDNLRDLQQRRQSAQENIREQRALLAEAQAERNATLAEIVQMDIELTELTYEYMIAREDLENTTTLLEEAQIDLAHAQEQRQAQFETLRTRIRFMHENNSMTYIELLFASENIADFLSNMEHITRIIEHDNNLLTNLQETEERIARHHDTIARHHEEISLLTSQLEGRIASLEAAMDHREARITELESSEYYHRHLAAIFEQEEREIQIHILNAEARLAAEQAARRPAPGRSPSVSVDANAVFVWPVDGPRGVNSGYGYRRRPFGGGMEFHTGLDLRAPLGTPILAAADGVVTMSQYRRGYGNTVVINHGGGLSTLYAHHSRLLVSVGDEVMAGDVIALAGSTGISTGSHLHFEVLINGQHTDPSPYLGLR